MELSICVYCAKGENINELYFESACKLGEVMAEEGITLVYGGSSKGLMGTIARAVKESCGKVIGVRPKILDSKGETFDKCDELIITEHIRHRKMKMEELSDAFISLPGGIGTFEELLETITVKSLGYNDKPIVILNVNNYFDDLIKQIERSYAEGFANEGVRSLYYITQDVNDALNYIENYYENLNHA